MCVHTVYVTLCNHDPGAQGKSSMAVQGWRTRVYVEDFPWLSCFSRTLDGQSTRIWHVQIPVMAKFSQILQKRSTKDNVSNPWAVHSVPEDCDGKKTLRNGSFLNDQRIQTAFLDVHPSEYVVKNNPGNIP